MSHPTNFIGKRLLPDDNSRLQKAARSQENGTACQEQKIETRSTNMSTLLPFESLPDEVICSVLSYLDAELLLEMRCLSRSLRVLASKNSAGWSDLCKRLWKDKIHVLPQARQTAEVDSMTAYRLSVQDAKNRNHIEPHELIFNPETQKGTIWSFRFKEAAGTDWTSWDPWYRGNSCRRMVLLPNGDVKEYRSPITNNDRGGDAFLGETPFAEHIVGRDDLMDLSVSMTWRFVSRPLDMPSRPQGSYIRFSVAGRDVPTYCVHRSPTKNWGFIMESCWGVYASFELPKRLPGPHNTRRRLRLRRAQDAHGNWFNVELVASDDEDEDDGIGAEGHRRSSRRLLADDSTFSVSSNLQWREALMYNHGARRLPDGDDGLAEFEQIVHVQRAS